jgi:hypothetical protein
MVLIEPVLTCEKAGEMTLTASPAMSVKSDTFLTFDLLLY